MGLGGESLGLLFKIRADSSQARDELGRFRKKVGDDVGAIKNTVPSAGLLGGLTKDNQSLSAFTSHVKSAGVAVAGVATLMTAYVGTLAAVGAGIFTLSQRTAEAGATYNDLALKVGLSVETLSGLDNQLKESGTSLDAFTFGVFNLQKSIQAASDGNEKMQKTLKGLGVTSTDTETALRQVLKGLAAIPNEQERNAKGAQVMGRAYKELAVFVADTNGDIDAAIEKARELGLVWSEEAARAADEFMDTLDRLGSQAAAVGYKFGREMLPEVTRAMQGISEALQRNANEFEGWGGAAKAIISLVGRQAEMLIDVMGRLNSVLRNLFPGAALMQNATDVVQGFDPDRVSSVIRNTAKSVSTPKFGGLMGGGGGRGGGGGGQSKAQQEAMALLESELKDFERHYRNQADALKREYDLSIKSLDDFTNAVIAKEEERYAKRKEILHKELDIAKDARERRKIDDELVAAQDERDKNIQRAKDERDKKNLDALWASKKREEEINKEFDERALRLIDRNIEDAAISLAEGEEQKAKIIDAGFERRRKALELELEHSRTTAARQADIIKDLILLESRRAEAVEDATRRINDARTAEAETRPRRISDSTRERTVDPMGQLADPFMRVGEDIAASLGMGEQAAIAFGNTINGLASSVGGAMSSVIASFLMGEKVTGKAMLSMAKAIAAQLAATALVEALMQLAYAWKESALAAASAAVFDARGAALHAAAAAAHMSSAAAFGIIGGVAAAAAIAIPGGGGGSKAAEAIGSQQGSGSTRQGTGDDLRTITQERAQQQPIVIILRSEINPNQSAFADVAVSAVVQNIRNAGDIRAVIESGGTLATA